jgi:hypothetical protein
MEGKNRREGEKILPSLQSPFLMPLETNGLSPKGHCQVFKAKKFYNCNYLKD